MKKTKHTPGKWKLVYPCPHDGRIFGAYPITLADGLLVAVARYSENPRITKEEALANACLIAAAPEMLKALRAVSHFTKFNMPRGYSDLVHQVDIAIAKAEGETK